MPAHSPFGGQAWMQVDRLIEKKKQTETHGFLTVAGDAERGLVGGCLLLNGRGRPLEFHCTAPVRPNRAQVILFGPTLRPYVVGEQIAAALIAKTKLRPTVLWTDDPDVLPARDTAGFPIAWLTSTDENSPANPVDASCQTNAVVLIDRTSCKFGSGLAANVHEDYLDDLRQIQQCWTSDAGWIDLREPFERIREAIAEAVKGNAKAAA